MPVVVVSAFSPAHGAHAVDALAEGAFDLVAKPTVGEPMDAFAAELGRKVGDAATVRPHAPHPGPGRGSRSARRARRRAASDRQRPRRRDRLLDRRPPRARPSSSPPCPPRSAPAC